MDNYATNADDERVLEESGEACGFCPSSTEARPLPAATALSSALASRDRARECRPDLVPWRICLFAHQPRAKCYAANKEGDTDHPDYSNNGTLPSDDAND